MLTLDFATTEPKTLVTITEALTKVPSFVIRGLLPMFWRSANERERFMSTWPWIEYDEKDYVFWLKFQTGVVVAIFQNRDTYILSIRLDIPDVSFHVLDGLVTIMRKLKRRDLPMKINGGFTISMKAATTMAALAVAQNVQFGEDEGGILFDMAKDNEI